MKRAGKQQQKAKAQPRASTVQKKRTAPLKQQKRRNNSIATTPQQQQQLVTKNKRQATLDNAFFLENQLPTPQSPLDPHTHPGEEVYSSPTHIGNNLNLVHPHTLRIKKLYRKMLRDSNNWYGAQYDNLIPHAQQLREQFEKYRNITDAGEIETVIREAEHYLFVHQDPMPYRPLAHPNGGLWDRNRPMTRDTLKPPPSTFVVDRDYHAEERTIRHLHADEHDPDFCKDESAYGKMKVLRGEYWFDQNDPGTYNKTVIEYCDSVGVQYMPEPDQVHAAYHKTMVDSLGDELVRVKSFV